MQHLFLGAIAKPLLVRFRWQAARARRTQERFLMALIRDYRETEVGRALGLNRIESVSQFRSQVPAWTYKDYEPFTQRAVNAAPGVMTPDQAIFFAQSSGTTTRRRKVTPITRRSAAVRARVSWTATGFALQELARRGQGPGKLLVDGSAVLHSYNDAGIGIGTVSVGDFVLNRRSYERILAHPFETLQIKDATSRRYVSLLFALNERRTRVIAATYPILAINLAKVLSQWAPDLIADLAAGRLPDRLVLEDAERQSLQRLLKPNPRRARELEALLDRHGSLSPKRAWPDLNCIVTARGGPSAFYLRQFRPGFGDTPVFGGIYNTAEATFGAYTAFDSDAAVLAVDAGFFEFVPVDQWDEEQPRTLLCDELEVGAEYRILVSSHSGYFRYDIGDVFEVVGYMHKAPCITYRRRAGGLLSAVSEKTTPDQVMEAVRTAQQTSKVDLDYFCVTLTKDETPSPYFLTVEPSGQPTEAALAALLRSFDQQLRQQNTYYEAWRRTLIPAPRLRVLPAGGRERLSEKYVAQGIHPLHVKLPHLSEDWDLFADFGILPEIRM